MTTYTDGEGQKERHADRETEREGRREKEAYALI